MALADINVKKPREAQIWNCCTGNPVLRILPDSNSSKWVYTISRCHFHIESTFSGASVSFVFSHIARYVPSPEENSCIPITHFQCKNNFEHLLMKFKICLYFWGVLGSWRGSVASYTTDERAKNDQKERWRLNLEELKLQIISRSSKLFLHWKCVIGMQLFSSGEGT